MRRRRSWLMGSSFLLDRLPRSASVTEKPVWLHTRRPVGEALFVIWHTRRRWIGAAAGRRGLSGTGRAARRGPLDVPMKGHLGGGDGGGLLARAPRRPGGAADLRLCRRAHERAVGCAE